MPDIVLGFPGSLVTLGFIISTQRFIAFDLFFSLFYAQIKRFTMIKKVWITQGRSQGGSWGARDPPPPPL